MEAFPAVVFYLPDLLFLNMIQLRYSSFSQEIIAAPVVMNFISHINKKQW